MQGDGSITPEYLLQGAAYALEQCGLLLRDANLLYRNGSYASAVALAAFGREEQGRWRILRDLRKEALDGERITIRGIQIRCGDHVRKQEAGMTSIVTRADRDTGLGRVLETHRTARPGSKESKTAREQLKKMDRQKKKRVPDDRHEHRISALYVDALSADEWNRPIKQISATSAFDFLQDAANDYSLQYDRYTNLEIYKPDDPEFYAALETWTDRPALVIPVRPDFPAD